jgi:hypothetical protein
MLSPKLSKRSLTGPAAALLAFALWPVLASAQSQDQGSVAEAARRAREQKKAAGKPARTLTNDDLPTLKAESRAAAGEAASADPVPADQGKSEAEQAAPPAAVEPAADPQADKNKRAKLEAALRQAKAQLVEAQGEFDVRKRQAALDSDTFYSKTDYASDDEGKARLEAQAGQLSEKKSQVDALKAKVAALESALGQAPEPEKTPPN